MILTASLMITMLRVIFDTNIYGRLILEKNVEQIKEKIFNDKKFIVYGFRPIRKELRDTPKSHKLGAKNLRSLLLTLYDELTHGRIVKESAIVNNIARKYYHYYHFYQNMGLYFQCFPFV